MPGEESVTHWIQQLPEGDRKGVQGLWERYFHRLVALARAKLKNLPRSAADEEDVALSVFDSVIRAVENRRFPKLDDRDDLWQVLVMVTRRKAANRYQHEARDKRDYRKTAGIPAAKDDSSSCGQEFADLIGREPDPVFAATVAEECRRLLERLPNDGLRAIALAKMESYSNSEIAAQQQCSIATIERRLSWIRDVWQEDQPA
jgi:DNA-directed RNA polymerase specialized sigma24 family protein